MFLSRDSNAQSMRLYPTTTQYPQLWRSEASEPGFATTTMPSPGGGRYSDFSGILFNALIILSIVLAVGLVFFCLCSWCKVAACLPCCSASDDEIDGYEDDPPSGRRRRRSHRRRNHQVAPAAARRRSMPAWLTGSGGAADFGRFPTPPPSYFQSVDELGMPPTPPPGYLSSTRPAAPATPATSAIVANQPVVNNDEEDKPVDEVDLANALASLSYHRSCPNIRLVAPAPPARTAALQDATPSS